MLSMADMLVQANSIVVEIRQREFSAARKRPHGVDLLTFV